MATKPELVAELDGIRAQLDTYDIDNLTPEQATQMDTDIGRASELVAAIDDIDRRYAAVDSVRSRVASASAGSGLQVIVERSAFDDDPRSMRGQALRSAALRMLDDDESVGHLGDDQKAKFEKLVRGLDDDHARHALLTMEPNYRTGWSKLVTGNEYLMDEDERRALGSVRATLTTTDANGGYAIPELLDPAVILTNNGTESAVRQLARVVTGTADKWEGLTSAGVTSAWVAEGVEATDNSPTLDRPAITAHKAMALVTFTVEIGGDWQQLASEAMVMFADAKDRLDAAAFATGSGNGQPYGIITALDANTNAELTITSSLAGLAATDIRKLYAALPARWRKRNNAFVSSLSVQNHIRGLGDSSLNTQTVDLTAPYSFPLLGRPYYEDSNFPTYTSGTTAVQNIMVVGDWSNYVIYDRVGSTVEYIPHLFSTGSNLPMGKRGWVMWFRTGADSMVDTAFRLLTNT